MNAPQVLLTEEEKARLSRVANYIAVGINNEQAGAAVGLSASRISQMRSEDCSEPSALFLKQELDRATSEVVSRDFDSHELTEKARLKALENINQTLEWNADPDFSLKVLNTMSKLPRIGNVLIGAPPPLNGDGAGRVVLNLNLAFVNKVKNGEIQERVIDITPKEKEVNFMNPTAVDKLLHDQLPLDQSIEKIRRMFDQIELIPAPGDK